MSEFVLRAMITAPRDGTWVLLLDNDLSGASMGYWAPATAEFVGQWMSCDEEPFQRGDEDDAFSGWLPAPFYEQSGGFAAIRERRDASRAHAEAAGVEAAPK